MNLSQKCIIQKCKNDVNSLKKNKNYLNEKNIFVLLTNKKTNGKSTK